MSADGFWLGPTLLDNVTTDMSCYTDEIFGPVLSVVRVGTYEEAIDLISANPYGNGTAIITTTVARPGVSRTGRGGHGRHQRADPGSHGVLQLRRLEGLAVRRHPPTASKASTSSPGS